MLKKITGLIVTTLLLADLAWASESNFMVLGVIASSKDRTGVALVKNLINNKTFAVREGDSFDANSYVKLVKRKSVEVVIKQKLYTIAVGGDTATAVLKGQTTNNYYVKKADREIQIEGDKIRISKAYKDHLVNVQLKDILMQAAAVPHMIDGKLRGFELWEIEKNSIFTEAGLKDGDIITSINGHDIIDVGRTIQVLTSLKNQPQASIEFVRNGAAKKIEIIVQ